MYTRWMKAEVQICAISRQVESNRNYNSVTTVLYARGYFILICWLNAHLDSQLLLFWNKWTKSWASVVETGICLEAGGVETYAFFLFSCIWIIVHFIFIYFYWCLSRRTSNARFFNRPVLDFQMFSCIFQGNTTTAGTEMDKKDLLWMISLDFLAKRSRRKSI